MKKLIATIIVALASLSYSQAQVANLAAFFDKTNSFLAANVSNGSVNYKAIKAAPATLDALATYAAATQKFATPNEEKAFYLNTYNLLVIKMLTAAYPVKGPMEIAGFFDKKTNLVNGALLTLNQIENDIVRKKYSDARIHFALVCGAKSCPPIASSAFNPSILDRQLDTLTIQSINNPAFTKIDYKKNTASVSMLFNWYADDFKKAKGSVVNFLNAYLKTPLKADAKMDNYTYNWALNQ